MEPHSHPVHDDPQWIQHDGKTLRVVATDIDGTLTDHRRQLDFNGFAAIRALEKRGIPVILATGNVIPATKTYATSYGTSAPIVCENGGAIYWERPMPDGKGYHIHKMVIRSRHAPDEVVQTLRDEGHDVRHIASDPWRETEAALEYSVDVADVERLTAAHPSGDLYVVATGFAIHILHKGLDKTIGLQHALDWLSQHDARFNGDNGDPPYKLTLGDVLAIGDSPNDTPMIHQCGLGAAVGNGRDVVKEAADIVVDEIHGAGVRRIVEHVGVDTSREGPWHF